MSQIPTENDDDNRSVAASDSVQLGHSDEVPDQQEAQQQEQPQFGLHQNQFGSLSREDLIDLVRMTKKEAEESAKHAEEFSKRNIQLELEKAEVQEDLNKNLAKIVEMHKEIEEKSEEVAEKAKQNEALLMQINESTREQNQMATELQMKIQLSLETWYDMLAFVPRYRLGQIIPMIGDRKFASIIQKFLHVYREITIDRVEIVAPYEEDPNGPHPRVRAWQNNRPLRFEMAEVQMPANIKNFNKFELSYLDQSVLNFMQKFQQNGLLDNVTLDFSKLSAKDIVQPVLCHILPLLNGIVSVFMQSAHLVHFYDAGKSKEIYELNMKMLEETKILCVNSWDSENLHANMIDLYCRWLYQPARADGIPRVLALGRLNVDPAPISLFIDRLKQDFQMATGPVTFYIRIFLRKTFQPTEGICLNMDNGKTKERLLTNMEETDPNFKVLLISRYPLASTKNGVWAKEG